MSTALSQTQRAELRETYRMAQARYEGARQVSWLLSGHGHLSPKAKEAIEKEVETLRKRAASAFKAHNEAQTAFTAEVAARVAGLDNVTTDEAGRYHVIGAAEIIKPAA